MKRVSSSSNPGYRQLRQLVESSRERRRLGLTVLDGIHLAQAYGASGRHPERLVVSETGIENNEIKQIVKKYSSSEILLLSDGLFKALSQLVTPSGILAVIGTPRPQPIPRDLESCVLLEDLQDPGNLGSILRTAAAAGLRHVLLSRNSVHAWSPRVVRAGMGAHFMLEIHEQADLLAVAASFCGQVMAASRGAGRSLYDADLTGRVAFAFGNEGAGLSAGLKAAAHTQVSVPMPGGTESLNVAAAAAVCLFERVRQLAARAKG